MRIVTAAVPSSYDGTEQMVKTFQAPGKTRPLLVALHTWSYDYRQDTAVEYFTRCSENGWHCVFPDFRGPNRHSGACGSDAALSDIMDATNWAAGTFSVDHRRIFLIGESGGGHMALLAAGRMPSLWTAVSAWSPILDLARWHSECSCRGLEYASELETVCGNAPGCSADADREYLRRSPLESLWRAHIVPIDINTGIHDGHEGSAGRCGSVPVGHSIRAYNILMEASGNKRKIIPEEVIGDIERNRAIPAEFDRGDINDPAYRREIHLRRVSALTRLTLFEGGHEILYDSAFAWFERF